MKKLEFKKLAILGIVTGTVLSAQAGAVTTDVSSIGSSLAMGCASCGNKAGNAPNLSASCGGGARPAQQPSNGCGGGQGRVAGGCGGAQGRSYNYQQRSYTADAGAVNVNNPMAPQSNYQGQQPDQMTPQGSCSASRPMPMQGQPQAMPMQQGQPQAMPMQPGQSAGYNQPRYQQQQRGYVSDASNYQSNSIMSEEEKRANMNSNSSSAQRQRGDWGNRGDNRQGRMGPSGQPVNTPQ